MKEKISNERTCGVFHIDCGYISTCNNPKEKRCLESMARNGGFKDLPPADADWKEQEAYIANLLREMRKTSQAYLDALKAFSADSIPPSTDKDKDGQ